MDEDFIRKVKQKKIRKIAVAAVLIVVCIIIAVSVLKPGKAKTDGTTGTATIEIRCDQLAAAPELLNDEALRDYLPADGTILAKTECAITPGVTNVFEVTDQVCREKDIQIEYSYSPGYDSHYIEGINYFYEFSAGTYSGWIFTVNGLSANYGADKIILQDGDEVVWNYTVDFRAETTPVMGGTAEPAPENPEEQQANSADSPEGSPEDQPAAAPADSSASLDEIRHSLTDLLLQNHPEPTVGSIGGEWLIKGLVLADAEVPDGYYDTYYRNVEKTVQECEGILSDIRYTEYERVIIGLTAIGKDPSDVAGYDLTPYIDDYDRVTWQGVNSACYALISARAAGLTLLNEDAYIAFILEGLSDGSMQGDMAYADYLAFGLKALSFYADREDVSAFLDQTVRTLSECQKDDGSYGNCEATVEVIIGLCMIGLDPVSDERFIKNGHSLIDGLLLYYDGNGGFKHLANDEKYDLMSCEKSLLALDAISLYKKGEMPY